MSHFHTSEFEFDLPGEGWIEGGLQSFVGEGGWGLFVGRTQLDPEEPLAPVALHWLGTLVGEEAKIDLGASRETKLGALDAFETIATIYEDGEPDYFRIVTARYYDRAVVFAFNGPAEETARVDEIAERTAREVLFRRR